MILPIKREWRREGGRGRERVGGDLNDKNT